MKHFFIGPPKNISIQFFRYFWIGGSSAIIDLVVFSGCLYVAGLSWFLSAFIGYMVGLAWNYYTSIQWVFQSTNKKKEIIAVFLIALGGLAWTWLLLYIMVDIFLLAPIIAKPISQVLILAWNFSMRKWFVF